MIHSTVHISFARSPEPGKSARTFASFGCVDTARDRFSSGGLAFGEPIWNQTCRQMDKNTCEAYNFCCHHLRFFNGLT